jgi:hypothetical protein
LIRAALVKTRSSKTFGTTSAFRS